LICEILATQAVWVAESGENQPGKRWERLW